MSPYLFKEDVYYFIINIYYLFILIVRPAPRAGPQRSEGPLPILYLWEGDRTPKELKLLYK